MAKKKVVTYDVTPSWREILPILIAGINSSRASSREAAGIELYRMARAADKYNSMIDEINKAKGKK